MSEELKPCPFCQNKAFFNWGTNPETAYVDCGDCTASGPVYLAIGDRNKAKKHAIEDWNTRAGE